MRGAWRTQIKGVQCKAPLSICHLHLMQTQLWNTTLFDNLLFEAQLNTGFSTLLHLGEMVANDKPTLQDWQKISMRHTFEWLPHGYTFWLPWHKGDVVFMGNRVLCWQIVGAPDPLPIMWWYLEAQDWLFPLHPQLWLWANGTVPLWGWWISQFWQFFTSMSLAGQSMCMGGTTALTEAGAVPGLIMGSGWWSSHAWTSYVQKTLCFFTHWSLPKWTTTNPLLFLLNYEPHEHAWTLLTHSHFFGFKNTTLASFPPLPIYLFSLFHLYFPVLYFFHWKYMWPTQATWT